MDAIASDTFDYRSLNLEIEDIVTIVSFVNATRELAKVLKRRISVPATEFSLPSTPPRPTIKPNPNYSKESAGSSESKESWGSADSKPEHFTQLYVYEFIKATVEAVKLNRVPWIDPALSSFEIRHYTLVASLISAQNTL